MSLYWDHEVFTRDILIFLKSFIIIFKSAAREGIFLDFLTPQVFPQHSFGGLETQILFSFSLKSHPFLFLDPHISYNPLIGIPRKLLAKNSLQEACLIHPSVNKDK